MEWIRIGNQKVGPGSPCFIIGEAGVNHNGSLDMALQLVDIARAAGVNAIKFQTFKAERLLIPDAPKAEYQLQATDGNESQYEMLQKLELSNKAHRDLMTYCHKQDILFMSTPFDEESSDFLDELGIPVFKISSGENTNIPFLTHVACKGKPMIISTGMASLEEVKMAMDATKKVGNRQIILLHCVSNYPADPAVVNLRAMQTMSETFGVPVGYSDHTLGIEVAIAAVALGACVIEKHFTLDRKLPGPDHRASLEPKELGDLVHGIRTVESALGHGLKEPAASEASVAAVVRKSIVAAKNISAGTVLTDEMIAVKRPGTGLPPSIRFQLLGRTVLMDIPEGTLFKLEMLK